MRIHQARWSAPEGWDRPLPEPQSGVQLVLTFGGRSELSAPERMEELRRAFPAAHFAGCSTAGEIHGTEVHDRSIVISAVEFERSTVALHRVELDDADDSRSAGERLARTLDQEGLVHVFVLSDGVHINGSSLVEGLVDNLPPGVKVTGGLAGDAADFCETTVLAGPAPTGKTVAALGLYGKDLRVGYGSRGGWDPFGPERVITRSEGNVLFELGRRSALDLYKEYLGPEAAAGLPATGLLFPLAVRKEEGAEPVVRTILGIDEETQSLHFAGDIPEGAYARLMRSNTDRLVDGAVDATVRASQTLEDPELAILVSCTGRKLAMNQRVEEELEAVRSVVGPNTYLTGFYSYGEIAPFSEGQACALHNQTMTITLLKEA